MKKRFYWMLLLLSLGLIFLLKPSTILADGSYEITNYDAVAQIRSDGALDFTQKITYSFDGDFNGVFYDQSLQKVDSVTDVSVAITQDDQEITLQESSAGTNNTYQLTQTSDNLNLKVYHQISDNDMIVTYHYVLTGLITNYQDSAELNWKILGKGWDEPLSNVKVTVQFPTAPINSLQAWTHGPLTGQTNVDKQKGQVTMTLPELSTDAMLETHMLFPTSVTKDNPKVSTKKIKASVQKAEAKLAKEANQKRQAQEKRSRLLKNIFSGLVGLLSLGFIGILVRNPGNKKQKFPPIKHSYEIPELDPLKAKALLRIAPPTAQELSVYFLELAGQNKVEITQVNDDYILKLRDKALLKEPLLRYLFEKVGNGQEFSLTALKKHGKREKNAKQLEKKFSAWSQEIYDQTAALGYFDRKNQRLNWSVLGGMALSLIALGILGFVIGGWIGWTSLALGIVIAILSGKYFLTHSDYTAKGQAQVYQLRCFKAMLKDVGRFDLREVGDIVLWEQILPYAVAFGLAKKVIKALETQFDTTELEVAFGPYYALYFMGAWDTSFTQSFATTFGNASAYSSATGGSGGFSGGSSGGGGGGTGGAF